MDDSEQGVEHAYQQVAAAGRDEVWIELADREDLLAQAREIDQRRRAGVPLPLAGRTVAVKDNIDVAGLPTTAACPEFSYLPADDAPVIAGLRAAGALILGKTNMDQFATGLSGTRSPYGAVRDARDPTRVSGGSSSGSAVAVALGMADIGVGTDTAGSCRVPAAFQGIFGVKPTQALLGTDGVVPACRSCDCLSLFSAELGLAEAALAALLGPGAPRSRAWAAGSPLGAPERPRIAVASRGQLGDLSPDAERAWDEICAAIRGAGAQLTEIDMTAFWRAGTLLYDGAFIAERYAVLGRFIADHRDAVDPSVATIILGGGETTAVQYLADLWELETLRRTVAATMEGFDALLLPTTPFQPTIAAVVERPIELNHALGRYTTFCNPLRMCAVAMPAGEADGGQFGVSLLAPGFHDRVVLDLAARWGESTSP